MKDQNFLRYMAQINSVENLGHFSAKNKLTKKVENILPYLIAIPFIVSAVWEIILKVRI